MRYLPYLTIYLSIKQGIYNYTKILVKFKKVIRSIHLSLFRGFLQTFLTVNDVFLSSLGIRENPTSLQFFNVYGVSKFQIMGS